MTAYERAIRSSVSERVVPSPPPSSLWIEALSLDEIKIFFPFQTHELHSNHRVWMRFHVIGEKNVGRIQSETYSAALKSEKFQNHIALTLKTFKSNYFSNRGITIKYCTGIYVTGSLYYVYGIKYDCENPSSLQWS